MTPPPPAPLFELWPIQQELFGLFGLDPENPVAEPAEEVLFGGMAGGSKSFTGRALCLFLALEYWPGSRGFICRQTFPEVYSTHIIPLLQALPPSLGKYNATTHQYIFFNGSILDFIHCAEDADAFKYLSFEWDYGFFDESTQLSDLQMTLLRSRVRSSKAGWRRIVLHCSNPGSTARTRAGRPMRTSRSTSSTRRPRARSSWARTGTRRARAGAGPFCPRGWRTTRACRRMP
jgi:hypothetical protein